MAMAEKVCAGCAKNVAGEPRIKDAAGRYFCKPCWAEHDLSTGVGAETACSGELLTCPMCGDVRGVEEMDATGVCRRCAPRMQAKSVEQHAAQLAASYQVRKATRLNSRPAATSLKSSAAELKRRDSPTDARPSPLRFLVPASVVGAIALLALLFALNRSEPATSPPAAPAAASAVATAARPDRSADAARAFLTDAAPFQSAVATFIERYSRSTADLALARLSPQATMTAMASRKEMILAYLQLCDAAPVATTATSRVTADAPNLLPLATVVAAQAERLTTAKDEFMKALYALSEAEREALQGIGSPSLGRERVADYSRGLDEIVKAASKASGTLREINALIDPKLADAPSSPIVSAPSNNVPGTPAQLNILTATWGVGGNTVEVTRIVRDLLNAGQAVDPHSFPIGHHLPGSYKTLTVAFAVEGRTLTMRADEAYGGLYLGDDTEQAPGRLPISVLTARWGTPNNEVDVTQRVAHLQRIGQSLDQQPATLGANDPAPGVRKMLSLEILVGTSVVRVSSEALSARVTLSARPADASDAQRASAVANSGESVQHDPVATEERPTPRAVAIASGSTHVCPVCRGSGRDADAERIENTQNAGIVGSQIAGTGGSASIAGARVACPVCRGTGRIPD